MDLGSVPEMTLQQLRLPTQFFVSCLGGAHAHSRPPQTRFRSCLHTRYYTHTTSQHMHMSTHDCGTFRARYSIRSSFRMALDSVGFCGSSKIPTCMNVCLFGRAACKVERIVALCGDAKMLQARQLVKFSRVFNIMFLRNA
eukprot:4457370-Pleurochrysis_carterae.AAC.1